MGLIRRDEIRGVHVNNEVVCTECYTDEEWESFKEDGVITDMTADGDDFYFCDRCKKML